LQDVIQPVRRLIPFIVAELEDLLQRETNVRQVFFDV
jgi:hypothetical protein